MVPMHTGASYPWTASAHPSWGRFFDLRKRNAGMVAGKGNPARRRLVGLAMKEAANSGGLCFTAAPADRRNIAWLNPLSTPIFDRP
jgi:hypothetical protein